MNSNTYTYTFTFTVQGSQTFGCQLAANGGPVTSDQVLGGAQGGSFKNVACSQSNATRYPVTTSTGNFWHSFEDLGIPGRGFPLALGRTYNAYPGTTVPDGPLGFGWSFTYGMNLAVGTSSVVLTEEAGSRITFSGSGPTYTAPPRMIATLVRDVPSAGMYTLTRQAQETLVFNSSGQLVSQRDLNGHTTTLSYVSGRLDTVTDAAGRTLSFAWVGTPAHIKTVTDANEPSKPARVVTFSYGPGDAGPDLTEVIDVTGGRTNFAYDANHRMTRMRLPNQYDPALAIGVDPEVVANVYDASGRVTSQTDQLGRTTTFDYTAVAGSVVVTEPAGSTDAAGNPVTHARLDTYSSGLLVSQTLGYGTPQAATWAREYDPVTLGCTKVTDPNGKEWKATYDAAGNRTSVTDPLARTTSWTWTTKNLLKTMVDPRGNQSGADPVLWTTTLDYDDAGCACNLVRRSRPLLNAAGTAVVATQVSQYRYGERANQAGDLTTVIDPLAKEWTTDYDVDGNPTKVTDPLANTTTAVFDRWGRMTSETSPRGNVGPIPDPAFTSQFTYDPDNRQRTTTVANPPGPALTTSAAYDASRNLVSSTDGNGNPTTYEYDAADQARFVRRANGTALETRYWPNGSLRARVDGAGAATSYFSDPQGRLTTVVDPAGRATAYGYDAAGNRTIKQDPGGDCGASPKVACTTFGYDGADQLRTITYSDAITADVTDIAYLANGARAAVTEVTKATPSVTSTSTWSFDSLDRLVASTDATGATVGYTYDLRGALRTITYPGGTNTVTRAYDDAGRWTSVSDWAGNITSFGYDADDNLTTRAGPPAAAVVDSFSYDNAGRLGSVGLARSATPLAGFTYGRDGAGRVTSETSTGVAGGDRSYGYSALDQLCWSAPAGAAGTCADPPGEARRFGYDAADNLARTGAVTQAFDAANQLGSADGVAPSSAYGASGDIAVPDDYDGDATDDIALYRPSTGQWFVRDGTPEVTQYGAPDDVAVPGDYDGDGTADKAVYRPSTGQWFVRGATPEVTQYGAPDDVAVPGDYDGNGTTDRAIYRPSTGQWFVRGGTPEVTQYGAPDDVAVPGDYNGDGTTDKAIYRPSTGQWFVRGGTPEVTQYGAPGDQPVPADFDGDGRTDLAIFRSSTTWFVAGSATATFGYDSRGNRTARTPPGGPGATYGYDQANRLTAAAGATYAYDGTGLRMTKTVGGSTTSLAWDRSSELPMLLTETAGGSTTSYVYGPGGLPLEQIDATGAVIYYHRDQLGSTRALTDSSGTVVASFTYDPYGRLTARTGTATTPFGFAGQYTDAETGFQYLRARYYDPATGQFLTRDPRELTTGEPYGYVGGNPLNATDPSGEIPLLAAAALAWVAVEAGLTAWDAVGTARTVLDGCASGSSKLAAIGLFAAGIVGPGAGYGKAPAATRYVIGGMEDLGRGSLRAGEATVASRLPADAGNRLGNWLNNRDVLRSIMREGRPIRDASVDSAGNLLYQDTRRFITLERDFLRSSGWTYDPPTQLWMPPG